MSIHSRPITFLIVLFASELNMESRLITNRYSIHENRSCIGRLHKSPMGEGTAKLTLCNIGNYAYAAYAKIGTPGYGVWLEIDTGSSDTWIMTSDCSSANCKLKQRLNTGNSTTFVQLNDTFKLMYGRGTRVQGRLAKDRFCLAKDMCMDNHIFGAASSVTEKMYSDGVLGLGQKELTRLKSARSLFSGLALMSPIIGLRFNRLDFNQINNEGGELTLGYANRTLDYISMPLLPQNGGYWMIGLTKFEFQHHCTKSKCKSVPLITADGKTGKAILDSGSTYILSSSHILKSEMREWLNNGWAEAIGDHLITDCNRLSQLPYLQFTFNTSVIALSPVQYTFQFDPSDACKRRLGIQYIPDLPFLILGNAFLSNFHTIFDYGNQRVDLSQLPLVDSDRNRSNISIDHKIYDELRAISWSDKIITCLMTVFMAVLLIPVH